MLRAFSIFCSLWLVLLIVEPPLVKDGETNEGEDAYDDAPQEEPKKEPDTPKDDDPSKPLPPKPEDPDTSKVAIAIMKQLHMVEYAFLLSLDSASNLQRLIEQYALAKLINRFEGDDFGKATLLQRATIANAWDCMEILITAGVAVDEPNALGYTALMFASYCDGIKSAEVLLTKGASTNLKAVNGDSALSLAKSEAMRELLEKGPQPQQEEDPTEPAPDKPDPDIHEALRSQLSTIVAYDDAVALSALIEDVGLATLDGIFPPDSRYSTLLQYCAEDNSLKCLQAVLATPGVDVDAVTAEGITALMFAVLQDEVDCAEALLKAGANVNLKANNGDTALSRAWIVEMKELLKSYGAK